MPSYGSGPYGSGPYGGSGLVHLNASATNVDALTFQITGTPRDNSPVIFAVGNVATNPLVPAPSDSTGKQWNLIQTLASGSRRLSVYYAVFSGASPGLVTFTATFTAAQDACALSLEAGVGAHLTQSLVQSATAQAG